MHRLKEVPQGDRHPGTGKFSASGVEQHCRSVLRQQWGRTWPGRRGRTQRHRRPLMAVLAAQV
jgi:hypothetical protein